MYATGLQDFDNQTSRRLCREEAAYSDAVSRLLGGTLGLDLPDFHP